MFELDHFIKLNLYYCLKRKKIENMSEIVTETFTKCFAMYD